MSDDSAGDIPDLHDILMARISGHTATSINQWDATSEIKDDDGHDTNSACGSEGAIPDLQDIVEMRIHHHHHQSAAAGVAGADDVVITGVEIDITSGLVTKDEKRKGADAPLKIFKQQQDGLAKASSKRDMAPTSQEILDLTKVEEGALIVTKADLKTIQGKGSDLVPGGQQQAVMPIGVGALNKEQEENEEQEDTTVAVGIPTAATRLQRGLNSLALSQSEPGAFVCVPSGEMNPALIANLDLNDHSGAFTNTDLDPSNRDVGPDPTPFGMTVANLVHDDDDLESGIMDRQQASTVNLRLANKRRQSLRRAIGSMLALVTVVLVVTLSLIFVVGKDAKEEEATLAVIIAPQDISAKSRLMLLLPASTVRSISRLNSPQSEAFLWMMNDTRAADYSDARILQRYALATLYFSTGGSNSFSGDRSGSGWRQSDNWLSYEHHECDWFVQDKHYIYAYPETQTDSLYNASYHCDSDYLNSGSTIINSEYDHQLQDGTIHHLWLGANDLQGSLPEELSLLSSLKSISLGFNSLQGTLPSSVGKISDLEALELFGNELTGTIPSSVGLLSKLSFLWLMANKIEGTLPSQLGLLTEMKYLLLDGNLLTGKIPTELGLLTNMIWFWTYNNQMTGSIPTELGMMKGMDNLAIDLNAYSGPIPTELGLLSKLETLHISDNLLTGTLPRELTLFSSVEWFSVGGNPLTGTVPSELWQMTQLSRLGLYKSSLSFSLPSEIGLFTNLQRLWLWESSLMTGTIPTEIGTMDALASIALDACQLTGTLPSELGLLKQLSALYLNDNHLTASIPTELGGLSAMDWNFQLNSNDLTGSIPSELGLLQTVSSFQVHANNLVGSFPSELGQMELLTKLSISNTSITGTIPNSLCSLNTWTMPADGGGIWVDCESVECACEVCFCDR